jgi:hypothetical protein
MASVYRRYVQVVEKELDNIGYQASDWLYPWLLHAL